MATQPIDLSAGFVPLQQTQPQAQPSIDLSAGFVPLPASPPTGSISAKPKPTTIPQKVEGWAGDVGNDLKYGTSTTGVGWLLKKLGAPGLYSGTSEGTGDFMGSAPLGTLRTIKGMAQQQQPGKMLEGTGNVIAGASQAATIPSAFVAPEAAAEIPSVAGDATTAVGGKLARLLHISAERAGENFNAVKSAVGTHPVEMTDALSNSAMAVQKLADTGGSMPMVVNKFIRRVTNPDMPPLTYDEARSFYSNATRLSADEMQRLTPITRRAVGQFTKDLGDAIKGVADRGGKLDQFQNAMQEYRNAMRVRNVVDTAKTVGADTALKAAGAGAATYGAKKIWDAAKK